MSVRLTCRHSWPAGGEHDGPHSCSEDPGHKGRHVCGKLRRGRDEPCGASARQEGKEEGSG